jgi:preprotein translocase subunit SecB
MADEQQVTASNEQEPAATELPVTIMAQYIRDVSFENPGAPESLRSIAGGQPEMEVNIGLDARKIPNEKDQDLYEVALSARAEATKDGKPLFITEIQYGITVMVDKVVPEENHHPLLFIEIPKLAFPYVRQIISDLVSGGGFPPLFLSPVDFHALYMQRFGDEIAAAQKAAAAGEA